MNKNVFITYRINLAKYNKIVTRNYLNFSRSELGENLLWGEVVIVNRKENDLFIFDADLIKFFNVFADELQELETIDVGKSEVHNLYQTYFFDLKKVDSENIRITLDKKTHIIFNNHEILSEIKRIKSSLFEDLKVLFKDYSRIKGIDYLKHKMLN